MRFTLLAMAILTPVLAITGADPVHDEALRLRSLGRRALQVHESDGRKHPRHLVQVMGNLVRAYTALNRDAEAAAIAERALSIAAASLPPNHPVIAQVLLNYSACLEHQHKKDEAKRMKRRADEI